MSVDPLRPIRVEPTPAVRPLREREEHEREPRRHFDGDGEDARDDDDAGEDGLPHIDVRA